MKRDHPEELFISVFTLNGFLYYELRITGSPRAGSKLWRTVTRGGGVARCVSRTASGSHARSREDRGFSVHHQGRVTARSDLFSERLFSEEVREQEAAGADRSSKILPLPSSRREALRAVAAVVVVMGVAVAGYMVGNHDAERVAIGPLGGGVSGEGIALGEPAQSVYRSYAVGVSTDRLDWRP